MGSVDLTEFALKAGKVSELGGVPHFLFMFPEPPNVHVVPLPGISSVERLEVARGRTIITVIYDDSSEESFGVEPAGVETFMQAVRAHNPHFRRS